MASCFYAEPDCLKKTEPAVVHLVNIKRFMLWLDYIGW